MRPRRLDQRGVERSPENAQPVSYLDDGSYYDSDGMWHPNPNGLIGKMSQLSEAYMENGGIIPTLQMATGNWDGAGDTLKAVVNNMGKQAAIREQGLQQRLTHSNLEAEKRETIRTEYKARARFREREEAAKADRHSRETDDAIRKDWAKEKIRQEKEIFNKIRIKKLQIQEGLWSPSATVTQQLAESTEDTGQATALAGGNSSPKVTFEDLGEVSANPDNRVTRLMGDWLKQGEVTLLCAKRGVGKSQMATQIAIELAKGGYSQLFEVPIEINQKCVYFTYEMSKEQWGERYKNVADSIKGKILLGFPAPERKTIGGALQDCREVCKEQLQQGTRHLMLFIDPLGQLVKDQNNPQGKEAKELVMGLKTLQAECQIQGMFVTIMILVHTDKAGTTVKGSGAWEDNTDATIFISGEEKATFRRVELSRSRSTGIPEPFFASIAEEPYLHFERVDLEQLHKETLLEDLERLSRAGYEVPEDVLMDLRSQPDTDQIEKNLVVKTLLALTAMQSTQSVAPLPSQLELANPEPVLEKKPTYEFASDKYNDIDRAEKVAIYDIIKLEDKRETSGVEIMSRVKNCFGVTITGDFVSKVKRGEIPRPEEPKNDSKSNIEKIIQAYLADYPIDMD